MPPVSVRSADLNPSSLRRHLLPWVPLAAGPLLIFGPALLNGRALFWGAPLLQFTPWRVAAKQMLLAGHLPLWNPWLGLGAPLLANYQSALLYPPNWILLLVDVSWGQTLLAMLHLIWAGIGTAVLLRHLGQGPFAQTVAGLAFGMSGYLVGRAGFLSINAAAAWLPWLLVALERGRSSRPASRIASLAAVLALQWLAGHAQTAAYSWILAAAWLGYRSSRQPSRAGLGLAIRDFGFASLVAFGLAAVQLLPTLEYLAHSDRSAGLNPEFALNYSFWPWRLLGLLAPDLFGNPRSGDFWGYGNYWEDHLYLGSLPLLLAIGALFSRRVGHLKWWLLAVAAVALLLALGKNTPVFPWLFKSLPGFDLFQAPTRWNLLTGFALALLAGLGAEVWSQAAGRRLYWLRLGTAGAGAAAVAAMVGQRVLSDLEPTFAPAIARGALFLLAGGVLGLTRGVFRNSLWRTAAVGLVLTDLLLAARGLNPTLPLSSLAGRSSLPARVGTEHRLFMDAALEQRVKFELAFRFDTFEPGIDWGLVREAGLPNTTILDGLRSANNFDPFLPARHQAWLDRLASLAPESRRTVLRSADVAWEAQWSGTSVSYESIGSAVRARVVPEAVWSPGPAESLSRSTAAGPGPREMVYLEGSPLEPRSGAAGRVVAFAEPSPNRLEVEVAAPGGGWLVLSDLWFPGWKVQVDGQAQELRVADGLFRAVWVPPGEHRVEFDYRPLSVRIGLWTSLIAWGGLALLRRR